MIIIRTKTTEVFQAKYASTCFVCTKKIIVGDEARYLNGQIRHNNCKDQPKLFYKQDRKKVNKSFPAQYDGVCSSCYLAYKVGDTIRYNPDGELVHNRHKKNEKTEEICDRCWLVKPCDC